MLTFMTVLVISIVINRKHFDDYYFDWGDSMVTKDNNSIDCRFVNYTGKCPNLCGGILTLSINGVNKTFGMDDNCDYDKFWLSGGSTGFRNGYSDSYIKKGDWYVEKHRLPSELRPFATLLMDLFNDNVPKGCCGGCL